VVILWAWTAVLSGFVLVPVFTNRGDGIVPIGLLALALLLFTLLAPRLGRSDVASDPESGPDGGVAADGSPGGGPAAGDDPAGGSAGGGPAGGDSAGGDGVGVGAGPQDRTG
jgi:hypothetical protein